MIRTLVVALFFVHLVACLWYLSAKHQSFSPETWVVRMNRQDAIPRLLYLDCLYWALQTVATVGYGDFSAETI